MGRVFLKALKGVNGQGVAVSSVKEAEEYLARLVKRRKITRVVRTPLPLAEEAKLDEFLRSLGAEVVSVKEAEGDALKGALEHAELGITGADTAVADTGTIVLVTFEERERLVSALPPAHLAFVKSGSIVGSLKDAVERLKPFYQDPSAKSVVSLITGPSRTADIELQLTLGVHGPHEVHAVVLP